MGRTRTGEWGAVMIAVAIGLVACENESTPDDGASSGSSGQLVPVGSSGSSGQTPRYTVDCAHPGAGDEVGGGRCACDVTLAIEGTFNGLYTCREGNTCAEQNKAESLRFTQDGNTLTAEEGPAGAPTSTFTGTICKDSFVWKGGPTDGTSEACGTTRFLDASHYVKDSCYKSGSGCVPSFTIGRPDMTGQCTNTGSKAPEAAAAVVKKVCL